MKKITQIVILGVIIAVSLILPASAGSNKEIPVFKSDYFNLEVVLPSSRWELGEIEESKDQLEVLFKDNDKIASFLLIAVPLANISVDSWRKEELKGLLKWYGGNHDVAIIVSKTLSIEIPSRLGEVFGDLTKYTLQINKNIREVSLVQFISSKMSYLFFIYNSGKQAKQGEAIIKIIKGVLVTNS